MEDVSDSHLKRERPGPYGHPPPTGLHHMPPADAVALHNYHPPSHSGTAMAPNWNPTPSPYEGGEHRPGDPPPHAQPYPPQHYPPPPPGHVSDPAYSRQGSSSAPTRSPQNSQQPPYQPPPVNGAGHEHPYYQPPPPDFRDRPPYGHPPGPPNGAQPPPLHVATNHEMMPGQPQSAPALNYPHSAGPPGAPYSWGGPAYDMYTQRRKPVRAAQACDPCRQRKAKCDEGRPTCTHCKDNGLACTYRDVPPQKSEKQVLAINEKLESLSDDVKSIMNGWKAQEEKINRLLSIQESQAAQINSMVMKGSEDTKVSFREDTKPYRSGQPPKSEPRPDLSSLQSNLNFNAPSTLAAGGSADMQQDNMTTKTKTYPAAANLLSWPSIRYLIPKDQTESYVMDTESKRGLLRLFGCGEGEDRGDGHDGAPSPATCSSSGRPDDDTPQISLNGVWGTGQFPPAPPQYSRNNDHPGGLAPMGGLNLDSDTVDRYHISYLDNMHKLHPFMDTRVLRKMVTTFKRRYSSDLRFNNRAVSSVGVKRKRETSNSPNSMGEYSPPQPPRVPPRNIVQLAPIEHSVANAIILLVMALGKVCAHRDPLPGPVTTQSMKVSTPHNIYTDLPMSMSASAPASPYPTHANYMNGVALSTGVGNPQSKNMDIIPGLAYFTKAADILGEMPGGVDVSHVQANLLAGLYMGQLARILPSHWFIRNACMACQILIQSTPYRERKMSAVRRNLINFAFWSCLQLESDIIAEMEIPASGIVSKEASMFTETPSQLTLNDPERGVDESRVMEEHRHYLYQIQLRRTLNDSLKYLYNEDRVQSKPAETVVGILGSNLEEWRNLLGDWNWDDDDHRSGDINVARMRAKYYGAKYIIHRPALYWALHFASTPSTPMSRPSESPSGQGYSEFSSPAVNHTSSFGSHQQVSASRRVNDMRPPPSKSYEPLEKWILEASQKCIHAAVRSTTAFDRIPARLIITNIFGTAHAQFGNTLVLAATYNSPHPDLHSLVDVSTLRFLMDRTIRFLQKHEQISPTLGADARILQHVQKELKLQYAAPGSATSSFSSR